MVKAFLKGEDKARRKGIRELRAGLSKPSAFDLSPRVLVDCGIHRLRRAAHRQQMNKEITNCKNEHERRQSPLKLRGQIIAPPFVAGRPWSPMQPPRPM